MVVINLLPWRTYKQIYEEKIIKKMLLSVMCFSTLIAAMAHFFLSQQVHGVSLRIVHLQEEMRQMRLLKKQIRKDQHQMNSLNMMRRLQEYRLATSQLFGELGKNNAADVCFTSIVRNKNSLLFSGNVSSALALTAFLKTWSALFLFSEIKLDYLKQQPENRFMEFRFRAIENHSYDLTYSKVQ